MIPVADAAGVFSVWLDTLNTADRVNLLELYARSVMLIELGRATDWVDLFDPYAVVRCAGGSRQFKGRAELLELAQRMIAGEFDLATGVMTPGSHCRHTLTDVSLFSGGADGGATGYAHLTVSAAAASAAPRWLASGVYADRLHKCGAGRIGRSTNACEPSSASCRGSCAAWISTRECGP